MSTIQKQTFEKPERLGQNTLYFETQFGVIYIEASEDGKQQADYILLSGSEKGFNEEVFKKIVKATTKILCPEFFIERLTSLLDKINLGKTYSKNIIIKKELVLEKKSSHSDIISLLQINILRAYKIKDLFDMINPPYSGYFLNYKTLIRKPNTISPLAKKTVSKSKLKTAKTISKSKLQTKKLKLKEMPEQEIPSFVEDTLSSYSIYFAGPTDLVPEMNVISCDLAIIPVDGEGMDLFEAIASTNVIASKVFSPIAYSDKIYDGLLACSRFCLKCSQKTDSLTTKLILDKL
jgi:hypothetical protein